MVLRMSFYRSRLWTILIPIALVVLILYLFGEGAWPITMLPTTSRLKKPPAKGTVIIDGNFTDVLSTRKTDEANSYRKQGQYYIYHTRTTINTIQPFNRSKPRPELPRIRLDTINLIETGDRHLKLTDLCALESISKYHPSSDIVFYYTTTYPLLENQTEARKIISDIKNVRFEQVDLASTFVDTPLETWYQSGKYKEANDMPSHLSDAFRFAHIWKNGGAYIDTDVVVLKSLERVPKDCLGMQPDRIINGAVMVFETQRHTFLYECMKRFAAIYDDVIKFNKQRATLGPFLITDLVMRNCTWMRYANVFAKHHCLGLVILPKTAFYPVDWDDRNKYFQRHSKDTKKQPVGNNTIVAHWWRHGNMELGTVPQTFSLYETLTEVHCPLTHKLLLATPGNYLLL